VREGKIHDISGSESESKKAVTPKKIMSQIVSGQLEKDDVLMLTNATIFDYFSEEKIKKTIATLAPTQACAFLKNTLLDYKVAADFSTIIVKIASYQKNNKETAEAIPVNILQGAEVANSLQQRRKNIFVEFAHKAFDKIKTWSGDTFRQLRGTVHDNIIGRLKKTSQEKIATEPKKEKKDLRASLGFAKDGFGGDTSWLKKIGTKEYRLIIFIIIIALAFAGSLKIISSKRAEKAETQKIELATNAIKDKINSIEAALIYKDENKAQQLFQEATGLLANFNYDNTGAKATYSEMSKQIEDIKNKIYHLEKINKDAYFAKMPENIQASSNLAIIENNLYLVGGQNIYKINTQDGTIGQTSTLESSLTKAIVFDSKQLVLYNGGTEIFFLDRGQGTPQKKTLTLPANVKAVDITIYNKKMYLLGEKNIYSYTFNNGNFETPTAWLKQETNVEGNISIAVDGNVWVSAAGAEISRLFKGKKENFNLAGLYEPISNQTKIYTSDVLNNLYLLDSEKNRVTIADKQGKVLRQILGDNLDKIISAIPSANEKELYTLTEKGVYKLSL
jgi:hypothetical protein